VVWALCCLISACEQVRDFNRAVQWCQELRAFAERLQSTFAGGICRAHYAGVLIWRGKWDEAERELSDAAAQLQESRPPLVVESLVRLAELRRRQGRFEEAAELFRQVEWHPLALHGLAELALDTGRPRDAYELIQQSLRQIPQGSRTQRATALELLVRAEALLGNHARAAEALAAVQSLSEAVATLPLRAAACFSDGVMALAAGEYERARVSFQEAVHLFERCVAPYETARARLELASVLVSLDRLERAEAEAAAAHEQLLRLGSTFQARRAAALLRDVARRRSPDGQRDAAAPRLTERQVEVLRLIAGGMSDREIAAALVVSKHTVHRHVANILLRLDLPSRAAAVAYAAGQGVI
jgi:ATP/maltotriose-dependent transcriptional regulator MalT